MMNPTINGKEYQEGEAFGYHDVRYFVFARDNYTCQVCKKKNKILNTHHIIYRSNGGTDRAGNLITICTDCHTHENHQKGNILWKWMTEKKKTKQYKEGPFMNILRRKVSGKYSDAVITYGSTTTPHRKELGLEKTHYNDAIAITGIERIKENQDSIFKIVQFRKKKRSLHEATARKGRKSKNPTSKRNEKNKKEQFGFFLNDKVIYRGQIGWVSGFNGKTMTFVKNIYGEYITDPTKNYKQIKLSECNKLSHQNNWQFLPSLRLRV